jgi:basic membrane protein A
VLTSMLKRVDVAVYNAFKDAKDGDLKTGVQNLGLAEEGVGYALDENNRALITPEMEAKLDEARQKIISGELKVTDYYSTQ